MYLHYVFRAEFVLFITHCKMKASLNWMKSEQNICTQDFLVNLCTIYRISTLLPLERLKKQSVKQFILLHRYKVGGQMLLYHSLHVIFCRGL